MSGHSKWATIHRKKEKTDAGRGKVFTKIVREISVAVKMGGADPNMNPRLRDAVAKAKANNMPNDNVTRTIKKASGELGNINYEEITYEGYGVGGVAVIITTLTDNRNRTAGDVRHAMSKYGGSMGATGCVSWMFDRKGIIEINGEGIDEDELMMIALDAGAEDVSEEDGIFEVTTGPIEFAAVCAALEEAGFTFDNAEISMIPQNTVAIDGEKLETFEKMIDMLEDNDDVQNVYHNAEIAE
ncbi:MAG: YebC/PmpR family DNA-binding transcriptional regulator [Christensenellaceae bacterium]|nr:YebC/PmpR family DNA-binding transcriptional regulator [Christensenellaceae bacterium]MBR2223046.1 YebC/PmpR family DNA-binding transcriptional regulator [Christensenellaceae bacterium]